tara:strand:- start:1187 stop:2035 length:849 start_codon:yes stop_codon:yes gene_type:complete
MDIFMLKKLSKSLLALSSSLLFLSSFGVSANNNYNIEMCSKCSTYSMRMKAESKAEFAIKKVHVYNDNTGQLSAYWVEMDVENGGPISWVASPDSIVVARANAAKEAADSVPEPTLPASISDDAWEFARNSALQNDAIDWMNDNVDWETASFARVKTLADLFRGDVQPTDFVLHLQSGGKIIFSATRLIVDDGDVGIRLVFSSAIDKDGNRVAISQEDLNRIFRLSGGQDGTTDAMANVATFVFGAAGVTFDFTPSSGESSSFSCSIVVEGNQRRLHCVKVR